MLENEVNFVVLRYYCKKYVSINRNYNDLNQTNVISSERLKQEKLLNILTNRNIQYLKIYMNFALSFLNEYKNIFQHIIFKGFYGTKNAYLAIS